MSTSRTRVPAASGPTTFAHPTPGWTYPGTTPGPAEARNKAATPASSYQPEPPRGNVEWEMGPGGGIEIKSGARRLPVYTPGVNQLIRIAPERLAIPVDRTGATAYTGVTNAGGATWAVDNDYSDPLTGLPMLSTTLPASVTFQAQQINWNDLSAFQLDDRDGFIIPMFVPLGSGPIRVILRVSKGTSTSTGENRSINFDGSMIMPGWNLLQVLNHEVKITTEVGAATASGTTFQNAWTDTGGTTKGDTFRSLSIIVTAPTAPAAPITVRIGAPHIVRKGWAISAVMWSFDDVPRSVYDLALPVLEGFGFSATGNFVQRYSGDPGTTYMSLAQIKDWIARGHDAWGHTLTHRTMTTGTTDEKTLDLRAPRDFWLRQGVPTAARLFAYPSGAFDQASTDIAKSLGYRMARSTHGLAINPLMPAANPYWLPALTMEKSNAWLSDVTLRGVLMRGQSVMTYMHNAVAGGVGVDTWPATTSFYVDHLRRWCELVAGYVQSGDAICPTATQFFGMCGVDPLRDDLIEV